MTWILIPLLMLCGCQQEPSIAQNFQEIAARNGEWIYRADIPDNWINIPLQLSEDTTKPICEYHFDDIRLTIHSFPRGIPPIAQINRWLGQFTDGQSILTPEHHGGFSGIRLECCDNTQKILAWSMVFHAEHYRILTKNQMHNRAMDYTIKAVGPKENMDRNRDAIISFAQSFELIEEIPNPYE